MKDAEKNRDPERARKRAVADLRCAARKVGAADAVRLLVELFGADVVRESTAPGMLDALTAAEVTS